MPELDVTIQPPIARRKSVESYSVVKGSHGEVLGTIKICQQAATRYWGFPFHVFVPAEDLIGFGKETTQVIADALKAADALL